MLIDGYELVEPLTMNSMKISIIVALVKDGFQYKIEKDLMDDQTASIWLKISGKRRKNILVGGVYREHTLLGPTAPGNSNDLKEQRKR